jgi:Dynamin family
MAAMPNGEGALVSALNELAVLGADRDREQMAALLDRLDAARLRVLVAGEAKRGKSTLINALLGRAVLPSGVTPLTAVTTTVRYGEDERAEVRFLDGHDEKHPLAALADLVTERGNPGNRRGIADVTAYLAAPVLAGGVELVDTPGTGSVFEWGTETAHEALGSMDAAVFVLTADPPVSASERDLLGVSEWLIFQGLFQGFRTGSDLSGILIVLAAATLGLTGGLAIYAFVRGFGIPFLGMPRTRQAADARETGQPVAGPALLAVACVALAVGAPVVLAALSRTARTVTGTSLGPLLLPGKLTVIPAHADFSAFSPTYLAVFLVAACAVPARVYLAGRPRAASVSVPVWDGGMVSFRPRMQYSAMTFSAPTRVTFDALYRPSVSVHRASDDDPAGRSGPVHYEAQVTPVFERYLYRPVVHAVELLADAVRPLQSGDVNLYLLYVFLVILLAYLLGAV